MKKNMSYLDFAEQSSTLFISELLFGFVEFPVKKKKIFYDSMKRIVSSVLRSVLFWVYFIHLYAKISLSSVLRFIHILYV